MVYSTHYLHEIEELDAQVAIMDRGRVVAGGAIDELVRAHGSSALELSFTGAVPDAALTAGTRVGRSSVRVASEDPAATAAGLLVRLGPHAGELRSLEIVRPTLETVFLAVTGRSIHDDGNAA